MLGRRVVTSLTSLAALVLVAATAACGDLVLPDKGGSSGSSGASSSSSGGSSGTTPTPTPTPTSSPPGYPTTPSETFATTASGCGNIQVFVASTSQTHYLVITADKEALGLAKLGDTATVDLTTPGSTGTSGHYDSFLTATSDPPYCNDAPTSHVSSSTPIVSGRVTFTITSVPKDTSPGTPYGVDVVLENLNFLKDDGSGYELVPYLQYQNVTVGWYAG